MLQSISGYLSTIICFGSAGLTVWLSICMHEHLWNLLLWGLCILLLLICLHWVQSVITAKHTLKKSQTHAQSLNKHIAVINCAQWTHEHSPVTKTINGEIWLDQQCLLLVCCFFFFEILNYCRKINSSSTFSESKCVNTYLGAVGRALEGAVVEEGGCGAH